MQEQIYVGLDMGSSRCQQAVIGENGTLRFSRVVATSEQHLRSAFAELGGEASVHLEAGELSAWAAGIIRPLVNKVVVSHPRTLAWIARDPLKTDKRDAAKLAELLRLGRVHEVYLETDNKRQTFKHLVVHYETMSREQARQKSKIKAFSAKVLRHPAITNINPAAAKKKTSCRRAGQTLCLTASFMTELLGAVFRFHAPLLSHASLTSKTQLASTAADNTPFGGNYFFSGCFYSFDLAI